MSKKKFNYKNLLLSLVSTLLALVILEVGLRIFFSSNQKVLIKNYQDKTLISYNPFWKVWHYPNTQVNHHKDCFNVTYSFNNMGMRGLRDASFKKEKYRIALLGDSYVEGYGVSDHYTFAHYLDSLLGDEVEVLNFGASGGMGNVHQVAMYKSLVTHFKPDLTIAFFLNYNDLYDNMLTIPEGHLTEDFELKFAHASKEAVEQYLSNIDGKAEAINPVVKDLYVMNLASRGIRSIGTLYSTMTNTNMDLRKTLAYNYSKEKESEVELGYQIAAKSFSYLKQLTQQDSSELLVVQFADSYQLDSNWVNAMQKKNDFIIDPTFPSQKIKSICDTLQIDHFDLYPLAVEEIKKKKIVYPYFSLSCDGHMNAKGHYFTAEQIANYLNINR